MSATSDLTSLNTQVMTMSVPFLIFRRYRFLPILSSYWKRFASILDSVIDQECSCSCSSSSIRSLLLFVSPLLNEERVSFYLHHLDSPSPATLAPSMASALSAAEEVEEPYSEPYSESALESALAAVLQNGIQDKEKDESVHEDDRPIAESNSNMNENDGTGNENFNHANEAHSIHANQTHPTDDTHQENNHNNQLTPRPTHPNQLILRTLQHMAQSPNQAVTNQALLVVTQSIFAMQQRASQQLHANILHTTQAVSSHVSAVAPSLPLTARKPNVHAMR